MYTHEVVTLPKSFLSSINRSAHNNAYHTTYRLEKPKPVGDPDWPDRKVISSYHPVEVSRALHSSAAPAFLIE